MTTDNAARQHIEVYENGRLDTIIPVPAGTSADALVARDRQAWQRYADRQAAHDRRWGKHGTELETDDTARRVRRTYQLCPCRCAGPTHLRWDRT